MNEEIIRYNPTKPADSFNELVDEGKLDADDAFIAMVAVIAGWKISPLAAEHMADLQALVKAYVERTGKTYLL